MSRSLLSTKTLVLNLTWLIGLLSSKIQAIVPAEIQFSFLQGELISGGKSPGCYKGYVALGGLGRKELIWWIENVHLSNIRKIKQQEP